MAIVAWGSLIWCPGSLRIKTCWRLNGPRLPIEFARISKDGRLTLVIYPDSEDQPTYWAVSEFKRLDEVRRNVSERERAKLADIHYIIRNGEAMRRITPGVMQRMKDWLVKHDDLQGVVWTGLRSNWKEKRERDFTPEDGVQYLRELKPVGDRVSTIYDRAREYVRNTPPQIQTEVRRRMRAQGWQDARLPAILFEP